MVKSLSDLRAEKFTARPERPYTAVVGEGQKYVIEIQRLTTEHDALSVEAADLDGQIEAAGDQASERPRTVGEKADPEVAALRDQAASLRVRINEIRVRLGEVTDIMADYEGELTVRATRSDGDWERWRIAHPARDEGEPGHRDDMMVTGGFCDSDALLADLATYVVAWGGEELKAGDYDALNLLRPDKKSIATLVVGLYERGDDAGKLRSDLSALLKSEPFSVSPAPLASPNDGSSAGSPSSDTSSTTPKTA